MKLNIGCGFRKKPGYLNIDNFEECEPDLLMDLEKTPWDIETNSVDEIVAFHVLERLGRNNDVFFAVIKELYRVLKPRGMLKLAVPHPFSDAFHADPTRVRSFTIMTFRMLNKDQNRLWQRTNANFTMLAMMLDVDFGIATAANIYDLDWLAEQKRRGMDRDQIKIRARHTVNSIAEMHVNLVALKPESEGTIG